ncbi:PKD domain-containing protein [Desulfocurvibacter africanus]|uniref:PKD domain-containing protein n=1 Tax=Desulfocurvibacter africanus TaxID=873 RepID=UPI0004266AF0|nr:PKD domain-containing protein [Desulfocurvibacter africanus]
MRFLITLVLLCAMACVSGLAQAFEEDAPAFPSLKPILSLSHSKRITDIDFSDRHIVSGSKDGEVKLFARDGRLLSSSKMHSDPVLGVAFLGEDTVVSVDRSRAILWNPAQEDRRAIRFRDKNKEDIRIDVLGFSDRFSLLAVAKAGLLQVMDLKNGYLLHEFTDIAIPVSIDISASGRFLCLVSNGYPHDFIYIFDLERGALANKLQHDRTVRRASFFDDGRIIVLQNRSGKPDTDLRLVDLQTQADLLSYKPDHEQIHSAIPFFGDLLVHADDVCELVSLAERKTTPLFKPNLPSTSNANSLKLDQESGLLALLTDNGTAFIYRLEHGQASATPAPATSPAQPKASLPEPQTGRPAAEAPQASPALILGADQQQGPAPLTVKLDIQLSRFREPVRKMAIAFGDGTSESLPPDTRSCSHVYAKPGTYKLQVAVQTEGGAVVSNAVTISVKPLTFDTFSKDMDKEFQEFKQ